MQTARATGGFAYRPGYGRLSVVDTADRGAPANHKVLYGCPRLLAAGEVVETTTTAFGHIVYVPPIVKEVRRRPSYVLRKRRTSK